MGLLLRALKLLCNKANTLLDSFLHCCIEKVYSSPYNMVTLCEAWG